MFLFDMQNWTEMCLFIGWWAFKRFSHLVKTKYEIQNHRKINETTLISSS